MARLRTATFALALFFVSAPQPLHAQDPHLEFTEAYALAEDRGAVLARLLPTSEEWYEFTCREKQAQGGFTAVDPLLAAWIERYGRTPLVIEAENRQALLTFARDPRATFAFLRERLDLRFDDRAEGPGERDDLPTRLDPTRVARAAWSERARAAHPKSLEGFREPALFWLGQGPLEDGELREVLGRLQRPDLPGLAALVVRDLAAPRSGGFGSLAIHGLLRVEALAECARLQPELWKEPKFVAAWLARLAPGADSSWLRDPAERGAQLARLWDFARPLPAVHNSLKAHVLYHYLAFDLSQGKLDEERFLAYLRLPRGGAHVVPAYRDGFERPERVDAAQTFATGLPAIGDDESLVRACLELLFAREEELEPYAEFLDAGWLREILAETRLLAGDPDVERWSALLGGPARIAALTQRVELAFPPSLPRFFAAHDPVVLEADVKNVPTLLVKVFALDAFRYHVATGKEVDESIELDGLVANSEQTFHYDDPPLRRVRRRFELPLLAQPGTFVVELVGNGLRSRAVIHKGFLRHVETQGAAGHVFRVFDEAGTPLPDASLWTGGREYSADERGEILVPYAGEPSSQVVVLRQGERSTLASFVHAREEYTLRAAVHLDREALIAGARARLVLRPELALAGRPITLALLEEPVLTLTATDLDGLATTQEVRGLALVDERELVHELGVPERLARLTALLRGSVKDLAGQRVELASAPQTFAVNGIDATDLTASPQFLRTRDGYALELRGKDGEPKPGRAIALTLFARDFTDPFQVTLRTDAAGRIELGALDGITSVSLSIGKWASEIHPRDAACSLPESLHGLAGETLRVPYLGAETAPTRAAFSLLGSEHDAFEHLALRDGFLELRDLPAGDYELELHESGARIPVLVTRGSARAGWLIGRERMLERTPTAPLSLQRIALAGDALEIRVANPTPSTRLTVVATRYLPPFELFAELADGRQPAVRRLDVNAEESRYRDGRPLDEELRYVLERRYARKYPGNLLRRPSLLLDPLDLSEVPGHFGQGAPSAYASRRAGGAGLGQGGGGGRGGRAEEAQRVHPGTLANVDFLPAPSVTLANLVPDASGLVRVPLSELGAGTLVHVLALDGRQAVYATCVRPEVPFEPRARHLVAAFDPREPVTERNRIELVAAGGQTVIDEARTTKVTRLDSLAAVLRLFQSIRPDSIRPDPDLARFEFVVRWPKLSRAEKLDFHARFACHELHFFLHEKDPAFFAEVVRPFLANKLEKTFLDHWLLDDDLRAYLEPWAFGRLNLIERILLARRVDASERASLQRLVREVHAMLPTDRERERRLFELALANDSLSVAPAAAKGREEEERKSEGPAFGTGEAEPDHARELADDAARRAGVRNLYRPLGPTRAFIEHDYWHRAPSADDAFAALVPANAFWLDFALADPSQPFVSTAVAEASGSFLEMLFALAVLDLPFEPGAVALARDGSRTTLSATTPLLLVRKETGPVSAAKESAPLLLGENFLRLDARSEVVDGEPRARFVTDEFLSDVPYAGQVVLSNPTANPRTVELLLQIPAGALPVRSGSWTRGRSVRLAPYATEALEYAFYFPRGGEFAHYPAHVAEQGALVAAAAPRTLHVVDTPTSVDAGSWEEVARHGSTAEVLAHVAAANAQALDLGRIAWRLREPAFFAALTAELRARHVYDERVWSYGLFHEDERAAREYLAHQDAFVSACGPYLDSPLLRSDPFERDTFFHLELDPLVHARAHARGFANLEASPVLAAQYRSFLDGLVHEPGLTARDWAMETEYLLLQDRVEDALAAFAKIDPARLASRLQYDALAAYLCFFTGDVARARALAEPYRDYPVVPWRERFGEVLAQLDDAAGRKAVAAGISSQDQLAATEPALELAGEGRALVIRYRNLARCEVRYSPLDVEVAFSARPFARADAGAAAYLQPLVANTLALASDTGELALELPPQFQTANVLVEVRAGGLTRARTLYASALDVRYLEAYGQVAVADAASGAPLPSVYVKCFARLPDGSVRFHKDGYTDLRGRFDYASVSDDPERGAERYAVLVQSEELGADIREVAPPAR